jgi:inositol 1,4,5-triphosphate receptor type 1
VKRIEEAQNALDKQQALLKVLPHLSKTGDDIIREVLAFLAAMLFGGNEIVQVERAINTIL